LTTDGLHGFLDEEDIRSQIDNYCQQTTKTTLETTAHKMVASALKNDSDDNTSCLLVEIKDIPLENINEAHQRLINKVIPPVLKVGNKIDYFEIKKILHSSTRSHVYLAEDLTQNGLRVVLKAPSENFAEDTAYLEAFKREYWLGRKLDSDYIIKVHPQPDDTRFLYHICDHIEGRTLRQWMIDNPEPPLEKVRAIISEIAIAIRSFEIDGALIRDRFHEDNPVGDIDYIAPEYLLCGKANKAADRFSLAVIVYEMLSGTLPP